MKRKMLFTLWVLFWTTSALTVVVTKHAWMLHFYEEMLIALGLISMVLALIILATSGWRASSLWLLCAGLLVGQWWFIEFATMQVIWTFRGFAP
jgi:hypothetical protein